MKRATPCANCKTMIAPGEKYARKDCRFLDSRTGKWQSNIRPVHPYVCQEARFVAVAVEPRSFVVEKRRITTPPMEYA